MKCPSTWMATAIAVFGFGANGQTAQTTPVQVNSHAPTYLYGGKASKMRGDVKKRGGDNFGWKGNGDVTWEVQVDKSGEYSVSLCHAAEPDAVGQQLQITSGQSRLSYQDGSVDPRAVDMLKEVRQRIRKESGGHY